MGVFDDLIRNASEVANSAAGAISHAADDAGKALKEKADEVGGAVSGAVSVAGEAIGTAANEVGNAAADYACAAQDAAQAAADTAVTAIAGAANAAATTGADATGAVAGTVGTVATIASSAVSGAASAVEASVREMKEKEIASYRQNTLSHLGIEAAPWIILLEEVFGPSPTELTDPLPLRPRRPSQYLENSTCSGSMRSLTCVRVVSRLPSAGSSSGRTSTLFSLMRLLVESSLRLHR